MKRFLLILLVISLSLSGCAWFKSKHEKTAEELAYSGMEHFNKKRYAKAIEEFRNLKDWYPFSKFAILAELKIADAHFHLQEYEEAIFAYEEFENLHPRNEAVPYVIYQIGRSYFDQMDTIDRDQSSARKALTTFNRLIREHPQDSYAALAREHIRKCHESIAGNEFYVGLFYFKAGRYKAALSRFKSVMTDYPDVGYHFKAIEYIAMCEARLAKH
jgi:outer membrane protein assembly factor BamD